MLAIILFGSAVAFLRHSGKASLVQQLDPHCSQGLMNTEMTVCCMGDCGECSDTSDLCSSNRTDPNNPTGRESTCCPGTMADLPSCENSMAPCAVPESVRNPPDLASLTSADRHAKDDCGEAIKANSDVQHLSTAFMKFEGKAMSKTSATEVDCDKYGTLAQAAAACSNMDDCMGFSASGDDPSPGCLYKAGADVEALSDGSDLVYLKREVAFTAETYKFVTTEWSDCSKECGDGVTSRTVSCGTTNGVEAKMGMCTNMVAMTAGAKPIEEIACMDKPCEEVTCDTPDVGDAYKFCTSQTSCTTKRCDGSDVDCEMHGTHLCLDCMTEEMGDHSDQLITDGADAGHFNYAERAGQYASYYYMTGEEYDLYNSATVKCKTELCPSKVFEGMYGGTYLPVIKAVEAGTMVYGDEDAAKAMYCP